VLTSMFERDDVGLGAVVVTVYFLTRVFAEDWTGIAVLTVSISVGVYRWLRRRRKKRASESWAAATGRVESSEVKADAEGHVKGYVLHIAYSYKAGDDWYSGFEEKRYWREAQADAAQARIRGSSVIVQYNPRKPDESVMRTIPGEL
jgi:hypothetical protein